MQLSKIPSLLMILKFATTQRLTNVTFNTQNNPVYIYQQGAKVDKQYFTFELMTCSPEAAISANGVYFALHAATLEFATTVNGYYERINLDLGLSCSSYKKFKVSWIQGILSLWHIVSSKWQLIKKSNTPLQVQFSDMVFSSRQFSAEWRVFYYDESPAKPVREICIKM